MDFRIRQIFRKPLGQSPLGRQDGQPEITLAYYNFPDSGQPRIFCHLESNIVSAHRLNLCAKLLSYARILLQSPPVRIRQPGKHRRFDKQRNQFRVVSHHIRRRMQDFRIGWGRREAGKYFFQCMLPPSLFAGPGQSRRGSVIGSIAHLSFLPQSSHPDFIMSDLP